MRRKATTLALLMAAAVLLVAPLSLVRAEEMDFDDTIVEDVEEIPYAAEADNDADEGAVASEELVYVSPAYDPKKFHFADHFDDSSSPLRWVKSEAKKDDIAEEIAKYDGVWEWEPPQRIVWKHDIGLVLKSKAKHAAIAARLAKPFTFKEEKPLVVQYEVTMQDGQECGGSYIKLLSADKNSNDLTKFNDKTPYTIMFGPDKCGNDVKMHFIFRHVNPINGTITEKHCRKPKDRLEEPFKDKLPHLYTLIVRPDNSFEVRVDHKLINSGSLLSEFTPAVNPTLEIDDPEDQKPKNWDEREKIPDPNAQKPEEWDDDAPPQLPDPNAVKPDGWLEDEPEMIPDPTAIKPEDWESEIDGEWEAPLVDNPICEKAVGCGKWKAPLIANKAYKGKWRAPLIENANYQGKWAARKIANPDYFEDLTPFKMTPIFAIGIELWSMSSDILFDNLIITDDVDVARDFAAKSFDIKRKFIDKESETFLNKIIAYGTENPWSWRIALVLIITPLAFSLYRMFSKGSSKETTEEDAKKTDALQEDDDVAGAAAVADDVSGGDASSNTKKSSPKKKKSDLDVKEEAEVTASGGSDEKESDEAEEVEGGETEETAAKSSGGGGARKRRARKDQS